MTTSAVPAYRRRVGYQAALLGGFALLAAALLILGNDSTRDAIAERQAEDLIESLSQVIPDSLHDNNLLEHAIILADDEDHPVTIYRAMKQQHFTGFAYRVVGKGYAGDIELLVGVDPEGELLGVRVMAHAETPGLGDKIEAGKGDWILGFNGRSLANTPESAWQVRKDGGVFDAFSGATITPRAVVKAIYQGLLFFDTHRDELAVLSGDDTIPANADETES